MSRAFPFSLPSDFTMISSGNLGPWPWSESPEESQAAPASLHGVRAATTDGLAGHGQCGQGDCDEQLDQGSHGKPWEVGNQLCAAS